MNENYNYIVDISYLNSNISEIDEIKKLYQDGFFSKIDFDIVPEKIIKDIDSKIDSRLKTRMSQISLGVSRVLQDGGAKNINPDDEIYLFSSFAEIETTNKIIKDIVVNNSKLVSPALFHNSVHNTPLGYYTIIKKINNYCTTISDGLETGVSFCNFIKYRTKLDADFIVVAGDEWSDFFKLDRFFYREIYPIFISYKVVKNQEKGFKFNKHISGLDNFIKYIENINFDNLFVSPNLFINLHNFQNNSKKIFSNNVKLFNDKILSYDNPTGIIIRLALPFILELTGKTLVVENYENSFYIFEVIL